MKSLSLWLASAAALSLWAMSAHAQPADAPAGSADVPTPDLNGFWTHGFSLGFDPPPEGGPGPVQDIQSKAALKKLGQFVIHQADATNPILKPWAAEAVKNATAAARAGKRIPTKQETCFPSGVPNYWTHPLMMQVVQTPDYVVFLHARDHQIRIIPLNKGHLPNAPLSWYGDSVGHFDGDTLVIDTVALNDKTPVDIFDTPHTTEEHVMEHIRVVRDANGAKSLEVRFTVEDPGAFTMPWTGVEVYRGVGGVGGANNPAGQDDILDEEVCAENNYAIGIPDIPVPTENNITFR